MSANTPTIATRTALPWSTSASLFDRHLGSNRPPRPVTMPVATTVAHYGTSSVSLPPGHKEGPGGTGPTVPRRALACSARAHLDAARRLLWGPRQPQPEHALL
jgi:hypothetical protein